MRAALRWGSLALLLTLPSVALAAKPVVLMLKDGTRFGCGNMRENRRGEIVWRVKIPCEPEATPRATASPRPSPTPTAYNPCPNGCMIWDPVSDLYRCGKGAECR